MQSNLIAKIYEKKCTTPTSTGVVSTICSRLIVPPSNPELSMGPSLSTNEVLSELKGAQRHVRQSLSYIQKMRGRTGVCNMSDDNRYN